MRVRATVDRVRRSWSSVIALAAMWVLLWGDLSVGNVLGGVAVAVVVLVLFPLPPIEGRLVIRPWALVVLTATFMKDLVVASFEVAWLALRPGPAPEGAVVRVRLRHRGDGLLTMTAVLTTLIPGSVVIEAHRLTSTLYLHVLDVEMAGGVEAIRQDTLDLESRVLRAFASNPSGAAGAPASADTPATSGSSADDVVRGGRRGSGQTAGRQEDGA